MIWEAWQYFTTPVPVHIKKMGFLEEAIAMAARSRRCAQSWGTHYKNCQETILHAVNQCQQKRKILIFGAGSLLDVPLHSLSESFDEVILVDVVFLRSARHLAKPYRNVRLVERDVTGSLLDIYSGSFLPKNDQAWVDNHEIDCVVSLNLLSQLPLIPVSWLMKHHDMTESAADILAKQLIRNHLLYLEQFKGVKCLIADRWDIEFNAEQEVIDEFDPLWDVTLPEPDKTWEWEVIPLGEVNQSTGQKNRVGINIF